MRSVLQHIATWWLNTWRVWCREFTLVIKDPGAVLFFFALPTLYPIVYTLIYNPETVKKMDIVVVDHCATARSRDFIREVNRTEAINVKGYAADMAEAREAWANHEVFAIMEIPKSFGRDLGNGKQAVVPYYADMSLLLRYRQALFALTDIQLAYGAKIQAQKIDGAGLLGTPIEQLTTSVDNQSYVLGNPTQGFASFVMPGILVLILQQSMLLGVVLLAGGAAERRMRNNGVDPLMGDASPGSIIIGKEMCYIVLYLPMLFFTLWFVPWAFKLPQFGNHFQEFLLMLPMLLAAGLLGQLLGVFARERESAFLIVVFTSLIFLFLSGLTWPRYAMNGFWRLLSDCVPATWGVQGFVHINSDAGVLAQQTEPWQMLWVLTGVYFCLCWLMWFVRRRMQRQALSEATAEGAAVK